MPKEELIKLAEALASAGYEIASFYHTDQSEPPFGREIELKIIQPPKDQNKGIK